MMTSLRRFALLSGAALLVAGILTTTSQAAGFTVGPARVLPNSTMLVNPNYQVAPGLSLNQYAYNLRTLGRAYSYVPPYALGYNPYPAYVNYGPVYPYYAPPPVYYPPPVYNSYPNTMYPYTNSLYPSTGYTSPYNYP